MPPKNETSSGALPSWSGPADELLDARQAAALLTVKPSTLLAWARDGRVPVHRLGPRHLRWTRSLLRQIRDDALQSAIRI
jgi:excisionase family DNA binding protein